MLSGTKLNKGKFIGNQLVRHNAETVKLIEGKDTLASLRISLHLAEALCIAGSDYYLLLDDDNMLIFGKSHVTQDPFTMILHETPIDPSGVTCIATASCKNTGYVMFGSPDNAQFFGISMRDGGFIYSQVLKVKEKVSTVLVVADDAPLFVAGLSTGEVKVWRVLGDNKVDVVNKLQIGDRSSKITDLQYCSTGAGSGILSAGVMGNNGTSSIVICQISQSFHKYSMGNVLIPTVPLNVTSVKCKKGIMVLHLLKAAVRFTASSETAQTLNSLYTQHQRT
jgi:hypothetical protein